MSDNDEMLLLENKVDSMNIHNQWIVSVNRKDRKRLRTSKMSCYSLIVNEFRTTSDLSDRPPMFSI